jgi:DNA-binding Xre family transcriptional regulator
MPEQYIDKASLEKVRKKLWAISQDSAITLEDIQDRTGFSYSQVYRIVRGKNNVSVSHVIAVCKALEIQPSEVFNFAIEIPKFSPLRKDLKSKSKN